MAYCRLACAVELGDCEAFAKTLEEQEQTLKKQELALEHQESALASQEQTLEMQALDKPAAELSAEAPAEVRLTPARFQKLGELSAAKGYLALVKLCAARGASDFEGLMRAGRGFEEIIRYCTSHGARRFDQCLFSSAISGNLEQIELILMLTANCDYACCAADCGKAMVMAAARGHLDAVKSLNHWGVSESSLDIAMLVAASGGHANIVRWRLAQPEPLSSGTLPFLKSQFKWSPEILAALDEAACASAECAEAECAEVECSEAACAEAACAEAACAETAYAEAKCAESE